MILRWIRSKLSGTQSETGERYVFSDADRRLSAQKRVMGAQLKQMRHQIELAEMQKELFHLNRELQEQASEIEEEEDDGNDDNAFLKVLSTLERMKGNAQNNNLNNNNVGPDNNVSNVSGNTTIEAEKVINLLNKLGVQGGHRQQILAELGI